jgi:hypothetical protein
MTRLTAPTASRSMSRRALADLIRRYYQIAAQADSFPSSGGEAEPPASE